MCVCVYCKWFLMPSQIRIDYKHPTTAIFSFIPIYNVIIWFLPFCIIQLFIWNVWIIIRNHYNGIIVFYSCHLRMCYQLDDEHGTKRFTVKWTFLLAAINISTRNLHGEGFSPLVALPLQRRIFLRLTILDAITPITTDVALESKRCVSHGMYRRKRSHVA